MKKSGVASFAAVIALVVTVFCAGCTSPTTTNPSPGSTSDATSTPGLGAAIAVVQGQNFTIQLQSDPSTGYTWQSAYNNSSIMFINRVHIASNVTPGTTGADVFTFQGTAPGTSVMMFNYTNSSNQTAESVNYTITCTASTVTQGNAVFALLGQNFTIQLQANPSTGYDWQPSYDNSSVTFVNRTFVSSISNGSAPITGASGTDVFIFQGTAVGTSVIIFNNMNSAKQTTNSTMYTVVLTS